MHIILCIKILVDFSVHLWYSFYLFSYPPSEIKCYIFHLYLFFSPYIPAPLPSSFYVCFIFSFLTKSAICISSYAKSPSTANICNDLKGRHQKHHQYQEIPYFLYQNEALPVGPNSQSHYLQASDEEDLVVDEVVSLSMVGKGRRQRSESICSVSGPCVPPDLLLNTCKVCQRKLLHMVCQAMLMFCTFSFC